MEIRVVDFDLLTKNYSRYQDGIKNLASIREAFVKKMDPIRTEMESIVNAANSGLIVDSQTQQEKNAKFSELQEQAMGIDNEFKMTLRSEQDRLNKATYEELSNIITEWTDGKNVDLVMGKMEVVWCSNTTDITEDIIASLKERGEFQEYVEESTQDEEKKNIVVEDMR
jgi:Skp family chaperone for outer membrane proteins